MRRDGWENAAGKAAGEVRAEESGGGLSGHFGSIEDNAAGLDVASLATAGSAAGGAQGWMGRGVLCGGLEGRVPSGSRKAAGGGGSASYGGVQSGSCGPGGGGGRPWCVATGGCRQTRTAMEAEVRPTHGGGDAMARR